MTDEDRARITQDAELIAATDDDLPVRMDSARLLEILNASSAAQNAQREVARLIRKEAYDRGLAEGLRQRAARIDALTRAAYEDGRGDGRVEGRSQATDGWEREWAVRLRDGSQLEPDGEVYVRAHARAEGPNGTVVSRLVGPWEPTKQAPCPTCSGLIRETVGMVCQTCGTDYEPAEQAEARCTCPQFDVTIHGDPPRSDTMKNYDAACPACPAPVREGEALGVIDDQRNDPYKHFGDMRDRIGRNRAEQAGEGRD